MPQSLSRVLLHIVFSTKNREPFLHGEIGARMHAYLATVCRDGGAEAYRVGGVADHVHLACSLPRTMTISKLVERLKKESSRWIKKQEGGDNGFYWQGGYGAFSISPSHLDRLIEYIENQEAHHRTEGFQAEFRRFLDVYGIECDERYVWD